MEGESAIDREWERMVLKAEADRDRIAAQLAEVLEYAGHKRECYYGSDKSCQCGWTAMRERHAKGKT